ncbi:MAG: hypothetical protein KF749_01465 [Bacteroidetes bacterium]|nr:hypothetical protein [Bacteroidota bacterium]MCW5896182.1 hypothetical protein [Bacteroidota bacterium]
MKVLDCPSIRIRQFAGYVFLSAGIYGILLLTPVYFMEKQVGIDYPPPITHPEIPYDTA